MTYRPRQPGRRLRRYAALCVAACCIGQPTDPVHAADPPTARENVAKALADLDNDVPRVREAAYHRLMTLPTDYLRALRDEVARKPTAYVAREDFLHDIVIQVFSAGVPYVPDLDHGFLGVQFEREQQEQECPYGGVEIRHIILGLCASKNLREGDVILEVEHDTVVSRVDSVEQVIKVIHECHADEQVTLSVLRRGRRLTLDVTLGAAPIGIDISRARFDDFVTSREIDAETYWQKQFEPLFTPAPATRASAGR